MINARLAIRVQEFSGLVELNGFNITRFISDKSYNTSMDITHYLTEGKNKLTIQVDLGAEGIVERVPGNCLAKLTTTNLEQHDAIPIPIAMLGFKGSAATPTPTHGFHGYQHAVRANTHTCPTGGQTARGTLSFEVQECFPRWKWSTAPEQNLSPNLDFTTKSKITYLYNAIREHDKATVNRELSLHAEEQRAIHRFPTHEDALQAFHVQHIMNSDDWVLDQLDLSKVRLELEGNNRVIVPLNDKGRPPIRFVSSNGLLQFHFYTRFCLYNDELKVLC